jgi:hypothetical protein
LRLYAVFELLRSKSRWLRRRRAKADVKTDIAKKPHRLGNYASRDDNPLLGKIVGGRLYETFVPQWVQVGGSPFRSLLQGTTQEQTIPFRDQPTTPRTTTGFMAVGLSNGGQVIAPPPLSSKRLQVTGKRS